MPQDVSPRRHAYGSPRNQCGRPCRGRSIVDTIGMSFSRRTTETDGNRQSTWARHPFPTVSTRLLSHGRHSGLRDSKSRPTSLPPSLATLISTGVGTTGTCGRPTATVCSGSCDGLGRNSCRDRRRGRAPVPEGFGRRVWIDATSHDTIHESSPWHMKALPATPRRPRPGRLVPRVRARRARLDTPR